MSARLTYRRWSDAEVAILERLVERRPINVIARKLRRNPLSVKLKAKSLGCSTITTLDNYSMRFLAASLGVDLNAVRWWLKKGYLVATPNGKRRLSITAKDFAAFCSLRPDIVSKFNPEVIAWLCHKPVAVKRGRPKA